MTNSITSIKPIPTRILHKLTHHSHYPKNQQFTKYSQHCWPTRSILKRTLLTTAFLVILLLSGSFSCYCCSAFGFSFTAGTTGSRRLSLVNPSPFPLFSKANPNSSNSDFDDDKMTMTSTSNKNKFQFSIDRGGTFTDIHCVLPSGEQIVTKLLSEDPSNYSDAPTEGIRRILSQYDKSTPNASYSRNQKVSTQNISSIRMGTTVATNALLERNGEKTGLIITKGYKDLLEIGNQSRKNIFDLSCWKPEGLYDHVEEIDERVILSHFLEHDEDNNDKASATASATESASSLSFAIQAQKVPPSKYEKGLTNEQIIILSQPQQSQIHQILQTFQSKNIKSIAIVLLHSYTYPKHEEYIANIAKSMNYFTNISLSSTIMPMIKIVSRGHTACAAAYLTPKIAHYIDSFVKGFDDDLLKNVRISFMKSDGGLTPVNDFGGHQAILSGPAGGVVGYAKTAYRAGGALLKDDDDNNNNTNGDHDERIMPVIGFDMGGTSTDVSRYDGILELVFETTTAGVAIQAPQLDINTVAAGGGSRLFLRSGMFYVGPESAGKSKKKRNSIHLIYNIVQ